MDFHDLKVFCDLIESGRFSRAADMNYISQSAVSQLIKKLEGYYDVKLLERGREAISPTAKGQVFYRYAKELLREFAQLENDLKPSGDISGLVKVATVYSLGLHEMSHYVRRFIKSYPGVHLHLEYERTNRIYEDCLKNVIDVGVVPYPSPRPQLEVIPFFHDRLVLITPPAARWQSAGEFRSKTWTTSGSSASNGIFPSARRLTGFFAGRRSAWST